MSGLPERPDTCATCGAVGRVVYKDHVVKPNASALEFHLARLDPVAPPAQQHDHRVSGRVEIEHRADASTDEWLKRLAGGYAILAETNLDPAFLDRTLTGFAQTVPGAQPKQVNEIKSALKRLAAPVETVATVISDVTEFWIELEKDGEWHRIAEHSAHTEASACKGFLIGYCAAKWPEDRELAKKMAGKLLPRVRAVPKTVEGAK